VRVLALADLHGELGQLGPIAAAVPPEEAGLVLFAGDLTHFGPVSLLGAVQRALAPRRLLAVPGNCDPPELASALDGAGSNLHGRSVSVDGVTFAGAGGGAPSPFGAPMELPDAEMERLLERAAGPHREGRLVLLTHAPPRGTSAARTAGGSDIGSGGVREAALRLKPQLVVCGHVHEARGRHELEGIPVINPGPARRRSYALLALGRDGSLEGVRFGTA
jgi:Icc-related predicted phosphoesterase